MIKSTSRRSTWNQIGTAVCLLISLCSNAQKSNRVSSPDGSIVFTLEIKQGAPTYRISYKKRDLIKDASLQLKFSEGDFSNNITIGKSISRKGEENYELVVGKAKVIKEKFNELVIPLQHQSNHIKVNLVVKMFNDGAAFRYEFISIPNHDSFELLDENTSFNMSGDPSTLALELPSFTSSHEGFYTTAPLSDIKNDQLMDTPALFSFANNTFVGITEAALLDYAGMYLVKQNGKLRSMMAFRPDRPTVKVIGSLPHKSPWRVFLISDRIGALIESNIITNLNEPLKLNDVSWIRPGKTTFPWWNGNVVPDTLNAPGNNFITQKYYIDFCARNGIEFHSVVEYGLHQWYRDDGVGFQPGPHPDVTRTVPGLDMKEVCDYAKSKNVDVRVWVHWAALYPKLDSAFAQFEKWGLRGMMIDFMDRDDQQMVNIQTEMLEKAAKHHMHIQFHGAYKPTGIHRTYPNEFTREGTLNYEINKWDSKGLPPDHDINIPFSRMLAGSTDYHMGGFRAVTPGKFRSQYTRPLMLGTRGHMLGMFVVLESYLGMVCDYPDAYEGQAGFDFVKQVPTVWDETRVLDAKLHEYIVIARRKGSDWYVGAINNSTPRDLNVSLAFLSNKIYNTTTYVDKGEGDPNSLEIANKTVSNADNLSIHLNSGGGMAAYLNASK
ncbi:MAG: glycoside hydrolase family 97 protein [Chryseolinea sp.]